MADRPRRKRALRWFAAASTLLALAEPGFAQGGEPEDAAAGLEEVVVTGSHLKRVAAEAAVPLQVFTRDEIRTARPRLPVQRRSPVRRWAVRSSVDSTTRA